MNPTKTLLTGIALLALATTASANRYNNEYEFAQVVDVQPIYENYQVPENRRVCENRNGNRARNIRQHSNGGGAILGGLIGGLIGNRFGKGNGRKVATAAGVLVGSSIGSKARPNGYYSHNRSNKQHCYTQREYRNEQRLNGYNVSYDYNGRIYQTRMQNHPGDRVKVHVNVEVAEY